MPLATKIADCFSGSTSERLYEDAVVTSMQGCLTTTMGILIALKRMGDYLTFAKVMGLVNPVDRKYIEDQFTGAKAALL